MVICAACWKHGAATFRLNPLSFSYIFSFFFSWQILNSGGRKILVECEMLINKASVCAIFLLVLYYA